MYYVKITRFGKTGDVTQKAYLHYGPMTVFGKTFLTTVVRNFNPKVERETTYFPINGLNSLHKKIAHKNHGFAESNSHCNGGTVLNNKLINKAT